MRCVSVRKTRTHPVADITENPPRLDHTHIEREVRVALVFFHPFSSSVFYVLSLRVFARGVDIAFMEGRFFRFFVIAGIFFFSKIPPAFPVAVCILGKWSTSEVYFEVVPPIFSFFLSCPVLSPRFCGAGFLTRSANSGKGNHQGHVKQRSVVLIVMLNLGIEF